MSFRYEAFEREHFLEFLRQGLFDEDINEVVRKFPLYKPCLQFELVKYLRERKPCALSLKVLSRALSCSQKDARCILNGKGKIFKIVSDEKIIKALVIPGTSKLITNNERIKRALSVVKKFYGSPFAVFFEEKFSGKSFMLPLAVALCVENLPDGLVFTGKIDFKGNIFEVDEVEKKVSIAEKEGLRLITPSQVGNVSTIKAFLDREKWNLPFYITSESCEEAEHFLCFVKEEAVSEEFNFLKGLEIFYDIPKKELCLLTGRLSKEKDWQGACRNFYQRVNWLKRRLYGKKIFHFGIRGPACLAMGLGVLWGSQEPFVIYHYQAGEYHPIEVLNPREIKERCKNFQFLKVDFEKKGQELVVMLDFSHHELVADVKEFVREKLENPSFLLIKHKRSGNISPLEFKEVVKETASLIQEIRKEKAFETFHFFFSCPVAVAFMLGVAFGHYTRGFLYNYQKETQTYFEALSFEFLRRLREGENL